MCVCPLSPYTSSFFGCARQQVNHLLNLSEGGRAEETDFMRKMTEILRVVISLQVSLPVLVDAF